MLLAPAWAAPSAAPGARGAGLWEQPLDGEGIHWISECCFSLAHQDAQTREIPCSSLLQHPDTTDTEPLSAGFKQRRMELVGLCDPRDNPRDSSRDRAVPPGAVPAQGCGAQCVLSTRCRGWAANSAQGCTSARWGPPETSVFPANVCTLGSGTSVRLPPLLPRVTGPYNPWGLPRQSRGRCGQQL